MLTSTQRASMPDVVLFVERSGEFIHAARLSADGAEPQGNRVLTARGSSVSANYECPVKAGTS